MLDEKEKAFFRAYQREDGIPFVHSPPMHRDMTLRDYFAGQALAGMMATRAGPAHTFHPVEDAQHVYQIADAMLVERENQPQPKE